MHAPTIPPGQQRVAGHLSRLGSTPPNSLALEGGGAAERLSLALFWAARLNCPELQAPCLACPACRQIAEFSFRDLLVVDGREAAIKVDDVRGLRSLMAEPPRGSGTRVVLLAEAQALTTEAANCLLKVMEEPKAGNVFVLTAPQREWLLPTLVSRSFVLTLAWPATLRPEVSADDATGLESREIATALAAFWSQGRGWFGRPAKGAKLDAHVAAHAVTECRRLLGQIRMGQQALSGPLPPPRLPLADAACEQALDCLEAKVNPALVLDWLAVYGRRLLQG